MDRVPVDPISLTSLHALAEHVLSAALHRATGRIGLRVSPGGFSTPSFGDHGRTVRVEGTMLVVSERRQGPVTVQEVERRARLTTLAAAADLAGIPLGAPTSVFTPTTACLPDAPLEIEAASAASLAAWYALGQSALQQWAAALDADHPAAVTLWPEHFDVAIRAHDVNYGASPGDDGHPSPYLYVGPPQELPVPGDPFWNAPFGALRDWEDVAGVDDAVSFFRTGHDRLGGH